MQQMSWNTSLIKQCREQTGQAIREYAPSLADCSSDFGHITSSIPIAVFTPNTTQDLQVVMEFAFQHYLPVTLRGNGLSQSGQSLAISGGLLIELKQLNQVGEVTAEGIWVEACAHWADLIAVSLQHLRVPLVVPYNTHLTVGGVLSVGGVGASSFKFGSVTTQVHALEIMGADGVVSRIDNASPLFHAALGGQGQFGIITKACIALRTAAPLVRTYILLYSTEASWLSALSLAQMHADYIESFCSPAPCGAKLTAEGRKPFAHWNYILYFSIEYENTPPELIPTLNPWQIMHVQDESVSSFLTRHDGRFDAMRAMGQWELMHPWYECFVSLTVFKQQLAGLLASLPLYYATIVQVVPLKNHGEKGFFMLPEEEQIIAIMILNAGLPKTLLTSCLAIIKNMDALLLPMGGKRYLSGFLGENIDDAYWKAHYGEQDTDWHALKAHYDPRGIFCSLLRGREVKSG